MNHLAAALTNPTPTKAKREAAFLARLDWARVDARRKDKTEVAIPGLDVAALQRAWGPDTASHPQLQRGTFQVPLGASWPIYEGLRNDALNKFLAAFAKQGYAFYTDIAHRPRVYPGVYPAWDIAAGAWLLDRREFIVEAWFQFERPKPLVIELDPRWVEPLPIRRLPGSGPGTGR